MTRATIKMALGVALALAMDGAATARGTSPTWAEMSEAPASEIFHVTQYLELGKDKDSGNLVLLNPAQNVREVFDLLGLTQIFPLANTAEEAVAFFNV